MWTMLAGVPGKLKTLLDRLTATRAANLDNLNATVGSRAPAATALSNAVWTDARAARLDSPMLTSGAVKSVQSGFVEAASLSTGSGEDGKYIDITISAIDPAKALVVLQGCIAAASVSSARFAYQSSTTPLGVVTGRIINSTTLRLSASGTNLGTTPAIAGRWTVIEYA